MSNQGCRELAELFVRNLQNLSSEQQERLAHSKYGTVASPEALRLLKELAQMEYFHKRREKIISHLREEQDRQRAPQSLDKYASKFLKVKRLKSEVEPTLPEEAIKLDYARAQLHTSEDVPEARLSQIAVDVRESSEQVLEARLKATIRHIQVLVRCGAMRAWSEHDEDVIQYLREARYEWERFRTCILDVLCQESQFSERYERYSRNFAALFRQLELYRTAALDDVEQFFYTVPQHNAPLFDMLCTAVRYHYETHPDELTREELLPAVTRLLEYVQLVPKLKKEALPHLLSINHKTLYKNWGVKREQVLDNDDEYLKSMGEKVKHLRDAQKPRQELFNCCDIIVSVSRLNAKVTPLLLEEFAHLADDLQQHLLKKLRAVYTKFGPVQSSIFIKSAMRARFEPDFLRELAGYLAKQGEIDDKLKKEFLYTQICAAVQRMPIDDFEREFQWLFNCAPESGTAAVAITAEQVFVLLQKKDKKLLRENQHAIQNLFIKKLVESHTLGKVVDEILTDSESTQTPLQPVTMAIFIKAFFAQEDLCQQFTRVILRVQEWERDKKIEEGVQQSLKILKRKMPVKYEELLAQIPDELAQKLRQLEARKSAGEEQQQKLKSNAIPSVKQ